VVAAVLQSILQFVYDIILGCGLRHANFSVVAQNRPHDSFKRFTSSFF
jgi:hypothetical protein